MDHLWKVYELETQNIKWIIVGKYTNRKHKLLNGSLLESIQIENTKYQMDHCWKVYKLETQNIKWIIVGEYTNWNHKILNGSLLEGIQIGNTKY